MPFIPPPLNLDLFPPGPERDKAYREERARLEKMAGEYRAQGMLLGIITSMWIIVVVAFAIRLLNR